MNRPLVAPVNGLPFAGTRSRQGPAQAAGVARPVPPRPGGGGRGGKSRGAETAQVSHPRFRHFGPFENLSQIFFTPLKPPRLP